MLTDFRIHATLATSEISRARAWYAEKLGWTPLRETAGALVYQVDGSIFTAYESAFAGTAKNTVAAWGVADLRVEMDRLRGRGVVFEDVDLGDMKTVDGIATDEFGGIEAWIRDSDGNWIAISEVDEEVNERAEKALGLTKPLPPAELGIRPLLAASDLDRARTWYEQNLGLPPYLEIPGEVLIYLSGATRFAIFPTPNAGTARNTVATWWVDDVRADVEALRARGVQFNDYDLGDAKTVDGILEDEDGQMAWFTDSEGNILGIGHFPSLAGIEAEGGLAGVTA